MTPIINKRKCPAQNDLCKAIPACPSEAIYFQEDAAEPLGGKILIDVTKCNNCGLVSKLAVGKR